MGEKTFYRYKLYRKKGEIERVTHRMWMWIKILSCVFLAYIAALLLFIQIPAVFFWGFLGLVVLGIIFSAVLSHYRIANSENDYNNKLKELELLNEWLNANGYSERKKIKSLYSSIEQDIIERERHHDKLIKLIMPLLTVLLIPLFIYFFDIIAQHESFPFEYVINLWTFTLLAISVVIIIIIFMCIAKELGFLKSKSAYKEFRDDLKYILDTKYDTEENPTNTTAT